MIQNLLQIFLQELYLLWRSIPVYEYCMNVRHAYFCLEYDTDFLDSDCNNWCLFVLQSMLLIRFYIHFSNDASNPYPAGWKMIWFCYQYRARTAYTSMQSDLRLLYCWLTIFRFSSWYPLKWKWRVLKNGRWITPFMKFSRLRVNKNVLIQFYVIITVHSLNNKTVTWKIYTNKFL